MSRIPPTPKNGGPPIGIEPQPQVVPVTPVTIDLGSCQWRIGTETQPDGSKVTHIQFVHMSGAMAFHTALTEEAKQEFVRQLTGGVVVPGIQLG